MTTADLHEIAPNLVVIEGHRPHAVWEDPDLATIAVYRGERTLYLLDTGVGPEQRAALLRVAERLGDGAEEVLLLNSHGHMDHLGNNDVLAEIPAARRRHLMPSAARPALDFEAFFGRMYHRGVPYVDYLDGLSLDPAAIASILRAVGADPDLTDADVADLGKRIAELGITPAIGQFIPSLLVDMLVRTYPTLYPSVETMEDYEDLAPAGTVRIGATDWNGWSLNGGEVNVLLSEGHSAGGVVFHVPDHRFLMMADETTSIPIWADSDPRNAVATAQRALAMMDAGDLDVLAAGHRPLLPVRGDEARGVLRGVVGGGAGHDPHRLRPRPDDVADEHGRTQPGRGGEAVAGLGGAADRAAARRDAGRGRGRRRGARDRAPGHPGLGRAGGGGRDHRGLRGEHRGVSPSRCWSRPGCSPGSGSPPTPRRRPSPWPDERRPGRGGARDRSRPPRLPCCA